MCIKFILLHNLFTFSYDISILNCLSLEATATNRFPSYVYVWMSNWVYQSWKTGLNPGGLIFHIRFNIQTENSSVFFFLPQIKCCNIFWTRIYINMWLWGTKIFHCFVSHIRITTEERWNGSWESFWGNRMEISRALFLLLKLFITFCGLIEYLVY